MAGNCTTKESGRTHYFNITYACNSRCVFCAANLIQEPQRKQESMALSDFSAILSSLKISSDDWVMICGGEPTVHPKFFGFLAEIARKGAKSVVFTNGRILSRQSFATRLLAFLPIELLISIYAVNPEQHDAFTGVLGSQAETLQGITNIFAMQREGHNIPIEFRLLLSRYTAPFLSEIIHYFSRIYPSQDFWFYLSTLNVSQQAKDGGYVASLFDFLPLIAEVINTAKRCGRNLNVSQIPKCVLWQVQPDLAISQKEDCFMPRAETYFSPKCLSLQKPTVPLSYAPACEGCVFYNQCPGFPEGHLDTLGDIDSRPVSAHEYLEFTSKNLAKGLQRGELFKCFSCSR